MMALPFDQQFSLPPSQPRPATTIFDLTFFCIWGVSLRLLVRSNGFMLGLDVRGSRWALALGKVN